MSVFTRIIIITFFLCASPKLFDSLQIPVKIGNLNNYEVAELFSICVQFKDLKMSNGSFYTATHITGVAGVERPDLLYKGTAKYPDYYNIPVEGKTLYEILHDTPLYEISLRIINVVESVGVFLLIKMSMLANHIAGLSPTSVELFQCIEDATDKIFGKFRQLSISFEPIKKLRSIIKLFDNKVEIAIQDKAQFEYECDEFTKKYSHLIGLVDIGDVNLSTIHPNTNTVEDFFYLLLEFINANIDKYFNPVELSTPMKIDNLQAGDVMELFTLCWKFVDLRMSDGTIYTETDEREVSADVLHKGTAKFIDYKLPVVNRNLFEIMDDMAVEHLLPEISLRIINVVESVGVFLLIKINMFASGIMGLPQQLRAMYATSLLYFIETIEKKFFELSIPRKPIEELRKIIRPLTYAFDVTFSYVANFQDACTSFMNKYINLVGFVDIGDDNSSTDIADPFLEIHLRFITTKVNHYFITITSLPTADELQYASFSEENW